MGSDKLAGTRVIIRGGGDLASGVILRLQRSGFKMLVLELEKPLVVRRRVAFAEAVYENQIQIEGVIGKLIKNLDEVESCWTKREVPVFIDPMGQSIRNFKADVLVDARMLKKDIDQDLTSVPIIIGLGPGFKVGMNCHMIIETQRGPFLGRVIREGSAEANTGVPETVQGHGQERVLRAPISGVFHAIHQIGDMVEEGEVLGDVNGFPLRAPFTGMIRGLIRHRSEVQKDMKLGDVDPRKDARLVDMVSDKALAIAGGVLEAILSAG
jgi:xanthine dehydrogenase accessory factor